MAKEKIIKVNSGSINFSSVLQKALKEELNLA